MKVIIVEGGLVRSVFSDRREKVHVFDYDGDDSEQKEQDEKEAQRLIGKFKLKEIY